MGGQTKTLPTITPTFPEFKNVTLQIQSWSSVSCTFRVEGFTEYGTFHVDVTPTTDRAGNTATHRIPGIPIFMKIGTTAGTVRRGQLYVKVNIQMAGFTVGGLAERYIDGRSNAIYPAGLTENSRVWPGHSNSVAGTNPAANTEISETVPTGAIYKLEGMQFTLVADANVATRQVHVIIDDGTTELYRFTAQTTQIATLTRTYILAPVGYQPSAVTTFIWIPIPADLILPAAYRIRTSTDNLQAGDDYGAPQLKIQELLI